MGRSSCCRTRHQNFPGPPGRPWIARPRYMSATSWRGRTNQPPRKNCWTGSTYVGQALARRKKPLPRPVILQSPKLSSAGIVGWLYPASLTSFTIKAAMGVTDLTAVQSVTKASGVAQIWLSITEFTLVKSHTPAQNVAVASASALISLNTGVLTQVSGLISAWSAERPLVAVQTWQNTSGCTLGKSPMLVLSVVRLSGLAPT